MGSSIGHAIGGFFGGGSSQPAEAASDSAVQSQAQDGNVYESTSYGRNCETDAKAFTRCLDENKGSDYQMSICGWYLEQLVSREIRWGFLGLVAAAELTAVLRNRKVASQLPVNTETGFVGDVH